jgi:hypothetical protein
LVRRTARDEKIPPGDVGANQRSDDIENPLATAMLRDRKSAMEHARFPGRTRAPQPRRSAADTRPFSTAA